MVLSDDVNVGLWVWSKLFQLDRVRNSKLSEYKYPCNYCSISETQTVSS